MPKPKIEITEEDWEWFWRTHDREDWTCTRCGGEGFIELVEAPELWGEDCLSEENRLILCPECKEIEQDIKRIILENKYCPCCWHIWRPPYEVIGAFETSTFRKCPKCGNIQKVANI